MFLFKRVFLILLVVAGFIMLAPLPPASAQSTELLLENSVCRDNPHSQDCICAEVRQFGYFPKQFDAEGEPVDSNRDDALPTKTPDGVWVDGAGEVRVDGEGKLWLEGGDPNNPVESDLQFAVDDRYNQRCAMSYFRENQRRLWVFAVWLGAGFTVISLIWGGVAYMQNAASGVELSRIRGMLTRVFVGFVILACALLIWDGISGTLFFGADFWTQDRGVYYELGK